MLAAFTDHAWQSTLVAILAAGVALALRKHGASLRYWLWFAASAKFLIPFALLIALGSELSSRLHPRTPSHEIRAPHPKVRGRRIA